LTGSKGDFWGALENVAHFQESLAHDETEIVAGFFNADGRRYRERVPAL
jgi:hypothetical protein